MRAVGGVTPVCCLIGFFRRDFLCVCLFFVIDMVAKARARRDGSRPLCIFSGGGGVVVLGGVQ